LTRFARLTVFQPKNFVNSRCDYKPLNCIAKSFICHATKIYGIFAKINIQYNLIMAILEKVKTERLNFLMFFGLIGHAYKKKHGIKNRELMTCLFLYSAGPLCFWDLKKAIKAWGAADGVLHNLVKLGLISQLNHERPTKKLTDPVWVLTDFGRNMVENIYAACLGLNTVPLTYEDLEGMCGTYVGREGSEVFAEFNNMVDHPLQTKHGFFGYKIVNHNPPMKKIPVFTKEEKQVFIDTKSQWVTKEKKAASMEAKIENAFKAANATKRKKRPFVKLRKESDLQ